MRTRGDHLSRRIGRGVVHNQNFVSDAGRLLGQKGVQQLLDPLCTVVRRDYDGNVGAIRRHARTLMRSG